MADHKSSTGRLALLAGLVLALGFLQLGPRTAAAEVAKQKVTWVMGGDGLQLMLLHVSVGGGFMAEEGIDLDLVNPNSGPRAIAAIMGGSAEIGSVGFSQVLGARAKGGKIVAVAKLLSTVDLQVVVSKEAAEKAGITAGMPIDEKIKRLKGMTIAITTPGSGTDLFLRSALLARGLKPDDNLKIQPMGGGAAMMAALQKHVIDGFVWGAPESLVAVDNGIGVSVINPLTGELPELKDVPFLVLVTSENTLANKPKIVSAVVRGLTKGTEFLREHPDEARKLIRAHFPDLDPGVFEAGWQQYKLVMPKTPVITQSDFQNAVKWLDIAASKPIEVPYDDIVKNDIATKAADSILK